MTGLNVHHETGDDVLLRVDERVTEGRSGFPGLHVVVDVVILCFLGALVYGLVKII